RCRPRRTPDRNRERTRRARDRACGRDDGQPRGADRGPHRHREPGEAGARGGDGAHAGAAAARSAFELRGAVRDGQRGPYELGHGYFITVKHAVVALKDDDNANGSRRVSSVVVMFDGKEVPAKIVDFGDADVEVHSGDWAIIKTKDLDLPALHLDTAFGYDFA